ncbi:MAG: saccharopine dehydrogenase NADP-binding domain-containing protein, partial [Ilumatobacteraceae bacterium]
MATRVRKRYDVVLFGPTGVTGREVARYLGARAPALGLTWAVAGRDQARIERTMDTVDATPDALLIADTSDASSIEAMVGSASVVANLVGPYARYGEPVHRACARAGVHQLDLTGEIEWVRRMIDRYHAAAQDSGAAIVPSAGFESLPFDLAACLAAQTAYARHDSRVVDVDAAVTITTTARMTGIADAVSGGTYASMVEMIRGGDGRPADPHSLDPPGHDDDRSAFG